MHVGVILPRGASTGDPLRIVAQSAEQLGYDSVWTTEHIAIPTEIHSRYPFTEDGKPTFRPDAKWFEGMVALGFVAALTNHIRIGTAVIPLLTRDPLSLAKQAATIDCLSNGRLELGLGSGWLVEEGEVLGHPTDHRVGRLNEAIDIMRKAWAEHPVEHHGTYYDFPPVGVSPKPVQGADIPIWIGGASPALLRTTSSRATGNILWVQSPDALTEIKRELTSVRKDVLVAASIYHRGSIDETAEEAVALQRAGADRILISPPGATDKAVELLESFASTVRPLLDAETAAASPGVVD